MEFKIIADTGERIFHTVVWDYIMVVGAVAKVYERNRFTRTVAIGSGRIHMDVDRYSLMGEYENYQDAEIAIRWLTYSDRRILWAELPPEAITELEKNCRSMENELAKFIADAANRWELYDFIEQPYIYKTGKGRSE